MVPFSIEVAIKEMPVKLLIEQLDGLADEEGYIRFDVRDETRRAVIFVNIEDQVRIPAAPQGLDSYFEAVHYTQPPAAFSFVEAFSASEIILIGKTIREHFYTQGQSHSAQTQLL